MNEPVRSDPSKMVNAKAAIPQLVNAIKRKITKSQDYVKDYEGKPWNAFVESGATKLVEALEEKQNPPRKYLNFEYFCLEALMA